MVPNDSKRIVDYFDSVTLDVTPALARPTARVLYSPVSHDPEVSRVCRASLSDTELERADRFVTEADRDLFLQRRAFRRYCASAVLKSKESLSLFVFDEAVNGRPYLRDRPDVWFGFSSSRAGLLAAWSMTHHAGVDIEDRSREIDVLELADEYFSKSETAAVEGAEASKRSEVFFQLWTLKEAALKSIGEGLPFGLDAFRFEPRPPFRLVRAPAPADRGAIHQFTAHMIDGTPGCAALVTLGPIE